MLKKYFILLRPHQYVKNLFIFLPIFFALKILNAESLFRLVVIFIGFSFLASSIYIINDYHDIEEDRNHPKKKFRPLASGIIPKRNGVVLSAILLLSGLMIGYSQNFNSFLFMCLYLVINIAYTLKLKHIPIIDVFILSIGFVIRLFVGASPDNISLSMWIVMMTFLLALFLALAKRRDDILIFINTGEKTRKVVDGYNLEFINITMTITATITILSYIMYTMSSEIIQKLGTDKLFLTTIWVLLGIFRYFQITFIEEKSGSPTKVLLKDLFILLVVSGWVLSFGVILYL